jgi:hypothetical protein
MKPTYYNYRITFVNGKQRNIRCYSILEAFCDNILFAMVNAWEPAIEEILEIETGKVVKKPSVNLICN